MPRENDDACANTRRHSGAERRRSPESISPSAAMDSGLAAYAAPRNDRWKCPISPACRPDRSPLPLPDLPRPRRDRDRHDRRCFHR